MNRRHTVLPALLLLLAPALAQQPVSKLPASGVTGIHHVSLSVRNLNRAVAFYTGLGLTEVSRQRIAGKVPVEVSSGIRHVARNRVSLRGPNGQIELNEFDGGAAKPTCALPVPGPGITHICYQSPPASGLYAQTKALGGQIISRGDKPIDRGYGIQYAYARDADGILYELEQLDTPPFTEAIWLGHVALATPDIDRLVAFYTKLLGIAPHHRIDNIRNSPKLDDIANIDSLRLRAAWFKTGAMVVEIWQFENPPTSVPTAAPAYTTIGYNTISFAVSNLAQTYQQLRKAGIQFLCAPILTGAASSVLLRDPDGNLLSLDEGPTVSGASAQPR